MRQGMPENFDAELLFACLPQDGKIVDIVVYKDRLFVATERRIFMLVDDRLVPVRFVDEAQ